MTVRNYINRMKESMQNGNGILSEQLENIEYC